MLPFTAVLCLPPTITSRHYRSESLCIADLHRHNLVTLRIVAFGFLLPSATRRLRRSSPSCSSYTTADLLLSTNDPVWLHVFWADIPSSLQPPQNRTLNSSYCLYMAGRSPTSVATWSLVMYSISGMRGFSQTFGSAPTRIVKRSTRSADDDCALVHSISLHHSLVEYLQ